MTPLKPRIGVVAVGRPTFDVDYANEVFDKAWAGLAALPVEIVGEKTLHFDSDPALSAFTAANAAGIDLLLLLQVTFTDSSVCAEIAKSLSVPLVVWTFPEARTGGRLRLNSFCGVNLASHTLSRMQKKLDNVHGAPDSPESLLHIEGLARAAAVVCRLARAKILVVGEHPTGFDACNYDVKVLKSRFGIESSYRQMRQAKIYTTTRKPLLRLVFVAIALLLRNLWVWIHADVLAEGRGDAMTLNLEWLRFKRLLDWIAQTVVAILHDGSMPCVVENQTT